MSEAIYSLSACEVADLVRLGELKAVEVLDVCLERIGRFDADLNAFVFLDPDGARGQAEQVDEQVARGGDPGPLAGVPIGVKDLEDVEGLPTGKGSLLFEGAVARQDSTQVARLRSAGAVITGKTTTPELGSLMFTWNKSSGTTRNPHDLSRTPGGSSGGSAAAVAAALVPLATGSDGGGSIRIPSSYSGLPGLKPTFGRIPKGPASAGSANTSVNGPIARTVRDLARYLDQAAGSHALDPYSLPRPAQRYEQAMKEVGLKGLRIVWSASLGFGVCDPEVRDIARRGAELLIEAAGFAEVEREVDIPDSHQPWVVSESIDVYSELRDRWPDGSEEVTGPIALAMQLAESLAATDLPALEAKRHRLIEATASVFEDVDLILTPTTPTVAFGAEGPIPVEIDGRILEHPMLTVCFTFPFNLTGNPAISLPAGADSEGLPVGLQIVAPRHSEDLLLACGLAMEQAAPWPRIAPDYA